MNLQDILRQVAVPITILKTRYAFKAILLSKKFSPNNQNYFSLFLTLTFILQQNDTIFHCF